MFESEVVVTSLIFSIPITEYLIALAPSLSAALSSSFLPSNSFLVRTCESAKIQAHIVSMENSILICKAYHSIK